MNILGLSVSSAGYKFCLLQDGKMNNPVQSISFSLDSFQSFLRQCGISLADIDLLAVCDRPSVQWQRILRTSLSQVPEGAVVFVKEAIPWIRAKAWMKRTFGPKSEFRGETLFIGRNESLAAATFFQSGFTDAAIFTMDTGAECVTSGYGTGTSDHVSIIAEQYYPHSLELLYLALMSAMGLDSQNTDMFMKLASGGDTKYKSLILSELMDLKDDGSFRLDMNHFVYRNGLSISRGKLCTLLGWPDERTESPGRRESDLARSLQVVFEEVILRTLWYWHRRYGQTRLCTIDSRVFRCLNRDKILAASGFDELHVQSDSNGATGAALFAWHQYVDQSQHQNHSGV